jgi:membrane protein
MKLTGKNIFKLFKQAAMDWSNDHAPRLGAALAFYTIFSLAPLITIVVSIASLWFSQNASQEIFNQLGSVIGADQAQSLQKMLVQPGKETSGMFTAISAGVMLVFGATGVFVQLQDSLNQIWEVRQKPGQGIMGFIRHRLLSLGAVLGIGFLLLVSLLLSAGIAAVGKFLGTGSSMEWLWQIVNMVVSFGVITVLFAFMFKFLPDAEIDWKDVWVGAVVTSVLFTVGKFGLGLYLGKSSLASTYSAAGALIVLLLWVYYSAQILFFGAELTQEYADMSGREVAPSPHAEWDAEKQCATQEVEKRNERKHKIKEEKKGHHTESPSAKPEPTPEPASRPKPSLAPAYRSAAIMASGIAASHGTRNGLFKKLGAIALLGFVLIPIQRKLFPTSSSRS